MERRRAGETSGGPDMRFRAFVAVVCVASVGTLLRSMGTIRHDEQLEEAETRSPPVVRVVVMADTHGECPEPHVHTSRRNRARVPGKSSRAWHRIGPERVERAAERFHTIACLRQPVTELGAAEPCRPPP
jgi:hypothetical protein